MPKGLQRKFIPYKRFLYIWSMSRWIQGEWIRGMCFNNCFNESMRSSFFQAEQLMCWSMPEFDICKLSDTSLWTMWDKMPKLFFERLLFGMYNRLYGGWWKVPCSSSMPSAKSIRQWNMRWFMPKRYICEWRKVYKKVSSGVIFPERIVLRHLPCRSKAVYWQCMRNGMSKRFSSNRWGLREFNKLIHLSNLYTFIFWNG